MCSRSTCGPKSINQLDIAVAVPEVPCRLAAERVGEIGRTGAQSVGEPWRGRHVDESSLVQATTRELRRRKRMNARGAGGAARVHGGLNHGTHGGGVAR